MTDMAAKARVIRKIERIGERMVPGPWWTFLLDVEKGKSQIWMRCPNGHLSFLDDHTVLNNGTVEPSVECVHRDCAWHEDIRLADW